MFIAYRYILLQKVEDHRKKWDRDEYEQLAQDRLEEELKALEPGKKEPPIKRDMLKPREYRVSESPLDMNLRLAHPSVEKYLYIEC